MESADRLILVGASVRAAAFSALRAGLRPWCIDLFADLDLRARCEARRLTGRYPGGFREAIDAAPPGPWMYTGGIENYPNLVDEVASRRRLWGVSGPSLRRVRSPYRVANLLAEAGLAAPALLGRGRGPPLRARWLIKPFAGAGGLGIRWYDGRMPRRKTHYLQQYIEGQAVSAVFACDGPHTQLLGVTKQLVGEAWLHAGPFRYCGSIGPLRLPPESNERLHLLGKVLADGFSLRGLFGVDGVFAQGIFWPVEVNPRYTASVEVLEYATGLASLLWHRTAFTQQAPELLATPGRGCVGKAVLFAPSRLAVPLDGPWEAGLRMARPVAELPAFADVPAPGEQIEVGRPVLTFFVRGESPDECEAGLRSTAQELTRLLEEPTNDPE